MKKIIAIVAMTLLWIASLSAQVPQKLTYQAVIRDAIGNVINNQDLEVQISILQGSLEGPVVYSEDHSTSTTVNGVITLEVGGGKTANDFSAIDWSNGPYYIRSTAELNGKNISVTSQLLSVPYALYAQRSFFANKVDEQFLEDFINTKIQSALDKRDAAWEGKIQSAMDEMNSIWEDKIQSTLKERDAMWEGKIQSAMDEMDSIWDGKVQSAMKERDAMWEGKIQSAIDEMDSIWEDKVQSALKERDSIWEGKRKALEDALDSISAEMVDTVPVNNTVKSAAKHGVLPGKFSMGENYQVHFSKGMLQYLAYKDVWRFAKTQYDVVDMYFRDYWMYPTEGWVDKYEHGSGPVNDPECSEYVGDPLAFLPYNYSLEAQENGRNPIHNGGNKENLWNTPSSEEWRYLFCWRDRADELYSKAKVAGVKGYVILPDDWTTPADLKFTPHTLDCSGNVYDKKTWEKMEALGAVFMPNAEYWTWETYGECTQMKLSEDKPYLYCKDPSNPRCVDDIISYSVSTYRTNHYRLVVTDSVAEVIMNGEALENEDLDGLETNRQNDYIPENNPDLSGVDMKAGLLSGKFSVSETKQVNFSQGNLQYNPDTKIWSFANSQYVPNNGTCVSQFRWSTSGYSFDPLREFRDGRYNTRGYEPSDISGTKYDWGVYNPISNGGNVANIWRTLTLEEWKYLINNRKKGGKDLYAIATVCGMHGMILLPDDWDFGNGLLPEKADIDYDLYQQIVIKQDLWTLMEEQGAVFLPNEKVDHDIAFYNAAFEQDRTDWIGGAYWSANSSKGMYLYDHTASWVDTYMIDLEFDYVGGVGVASVRLVRDVTE